MCHLVFVWLRTHHIIWLLLVGMLVDVSSCVWLCTHHIIWLLVVVMQHPAVMVAQ